MASIGERNALRVVREAPPGLYLDGEELGEILLPGRYIPKGAVAGDYLEAFVYRDSEDRLVATTEIPRACVGEFAVMKVVSVNLQIGAFLDWGLSKDLLLPIREQIRRVSVGDLVAACVFLDPKSGRIAATARLDEHLDRTPPPYVAGQRVRLLIADETPLGFKAIIENAHWGLLYKTDLGSPLAIGQDLEGCVRIIRPDGKIDLGLDPTGYGRIAPLTEQVIEALKAGGGRLEFNDRSTPESIRAKFGASKKAFKQALGALYRQRSIRISENGIELIDPAPNPKPKRGARKGLQGEPPSATRRRGAA
jgi:predicted RNA-binding protein (virulence factor B family)